MSNQVKGTSTNMSKLVAWDIDNYLAYSNENDCNICLSPAEKYLIRCALRVMKWKTRWTSELGTMLPDISTIAENLEYKMADENCCEICAEVAECIENDTDVQNAIAGAITNNTNIKNALKSLQNNEQGYLTPSENTAINSPLIDVTDCDPDEIFGNAVALFDAIDSINVDFLQVIAQAGNKFELASSAASAIPLFNQLPTDEALELIGKFADWALESYNAALTLEIKQQIYCDLFCIMIENCNFSFDQLLSYFGDYFTIDLSLYQIANMVAWLAGTNIIGEELVYAVCAFQIYIVSIGEKILGSENPKWYAMQAQLGDPSNDWITLCEDCSLEFVVTYDFSIDNQDFVSTVTSISHVDYSSYVAASYWRNNAVTNGSAVVQRRCLIESPDFDAIFVTKIEIDYYLNNGLSGSNFTLLYNSDSVTINQNTIATGDQTLTLSAINDEITDFRLILRGADNNSSAVARFKEIRLFATS